MFGNWSLLSSQSCENAPEEPTFFNAKSFFFKFHETFCDKNIVLKQY